jgi:hypothetical protein
MSDNGTLSSLREASFVDLSWRKTRIGGIKGVQSPRISRFYNGFTWTTSVIGESEFDNIESSIQSMTQNDGRYTR